MTNFLQCHGLQPPTSPVLHYLLEFAQTHVHWIGDAIQQSHLLPSSSAVSLSQHQDLFQWVSSLHQVSELQPQDQSFQEYSGLISFKTDCFSLLAVQGTLKSLLQHHSSEASVHLTRAGSKCCCPSTAAGHRQKRAQGENCHQFCSCCNRTELFYTSSCFLLFIVSLKYKFFGLDK